MGLPVQMTDLSSDSFPHLLVALMANCFGILRSLLFRLLHSMGMTRFEPIQYNLDGPYVGSGLAGLTVLAEQLNNNRAFSYKYVSNSSCSCQEERSNDCVVCLCTLRDGELVRKLDCRHVFHKECFDGWLHHLNFNCPLCRSPVGCFG